jgi:hypothetical protein
MTWQIAFSVVQTVFIFALGWFIKLLIGFSGDVKKTNERMNEIESQMAEKLAEVKQDIAISKERDKNIFSAIERLERKFDSIVEIKVKE